MRSRISALIYYHQPGDDGYRYFVPIYWHWWSKEGKGRIVFPFFWHFHDYQTASQDSFVFPLYQHHRDPDKVVHRLWPLFFYERYGKDGAAGSGVGLLPFFWASRRETRTTGIAPLLLSGWWSDSATGDYRALVLGLGWFSRAKNNRTAVIFPLLWTHRTPEHNRAVFFPLVWHFGTPTGSTTVVPPLGVFGTDSARGLSHGTLVPFFHFRLEDHGRRKLAITPLGAYHEDADQKVSQFIGFAPPIYHRSDARRTIDVVFPIALRWHDRENDSTTEVIGPFLHHADPAGSTNALLPLLWVFHDRASEATTGLVFPIALWRTSPSLKTGFFGPLYWYQRPAAGWSGGLFPLVHLQNLEGRSHQMVLPLFIHKKDQGAGTETTAVLLGYHRRSREGWDAGLFPLFFAGRRSDVRWGTIAGLYSWRSDDNGSTHVLGPLYASKSKTGHAYGLAPLINFSASNGAQSRWVLPPLYLHVSDPKDKSAFTMFGPLFRARSGDDVTQGLFPLLWGIDRGSRHYDIVFPIAARVRDGAQKRDHLWIGPYLRLHDGERPSTTHILLPLAVKHDAPNYHVFVQFPFFWRVQEGDETDTVVFPFYGRVRKPGLSVDIAFPLVWRFAGEDWSTTVVGPAFARRRGLARDRGLLPLFGWGSGRDSGRGEGGGKSYAWALPLLFWHDADAKAGTSRTVLATFLWERKSDGYTSALVPLWVGWRRGSASHLFGPLFYHGADTAKGTTLNVIGPFYYGSDPHGTTSGLAPFVFTRTHDDGRWSVTIPPLLHAAQKSDGLRLITPLFGFSSSPTGERGFVGPVYFRKEIGGYTASLIPIFYHSRDDLTQTTTTAVVPLFFRSASPERSITMVTPLIWRYRTIESSTTLAIPLFFDQHFFHESRTTGVPPFFIRHKSYADGASTQIIPPLLMYLRTAPQGTDFVLFPLVWRLAGAEGARSTVVFPLFWDIRRGTSTTQVMFPLYARWSRDNTRDSLLVLNMYYWRGRGTAAGTYYLNVFPLFDVGRARPQDLEWNLLGGAVGYSRIGRTRTLKLLYAIDVPLDPAKLSAATTGTFFTSTPSLRNDLF
ncbi:MAG: hypothetical protein EXR72_09850 [Myxococcales bacterium]|nr:hypothetical protein [Myxococcales bacterium]